MLRYKVYRGIVTSGATVNIKRNGKHSGTAPAADPSTVFRAVWPDVAIIDAQLAERVDAALAARGTKGWDRNVKHPLSGYGRCETCRGSIATANGSRGRTVYLCDRSRRMGACSVETRVDVRKVEATLSAALLSDVLSDAMINEARSAIRGVLHVEAERLHHMKGADVETLERELATVRADKAKAVKLALATDDDPDVLAALRTLKQREAHLAAQLASVRSAAGLDDVTMARIEAAVVARLETIRDSVRDRGRMRNALRDLFPSGLYFVAISPYEWEITGDAVPYDPGTFPSDGGPTPTARRAARRRRPRINERAQRSGTSRR
jgi:hypothetical protein